MVIHIVYVMFVLSNPNSQTQLLEALCRKIPVFFINSTASVVLLFSNIHNSSLPTRSRVQFLKADTYCFVKSSMYFLQYENPNAAAKRIARISRNASSWNRWSGFPTVRIIFCFKSCCPLCGSMKLSTPLFLPKSNAMALMVKSLRDRSSSIPKMQTKRFLGCLKSRYTPLRFEKL